MVTRDSRADSARLLFPDDVCIPVSRAFMGELLIVLQRTTRRLEQRLPKSLDPSPVDAAVLAEARRMLIQGEAALRLADPQ